MNEVARLTNKHQDLGAWDYDEEYEENDQDDLEHWYRTETGHPEVVGVGDLDYGERVRTAVAPLTGPLTEPDFSQEPTDFVSAARKAAQAAALAATEHSQHNKLMRS